MKKKTGIGKVERNCRGFEVVRFKDHYDYQCSLQQSSIAIYEKPGTGAIWLGCDDNHHHSTTGEALSPRMHLTLPMVKKLIVSLQRWVDNGSFKSS